MVSKSSKRKVLIWKLRWLPNLLFWSIRAFRKDLKCCWPRITLDLVSRWPHGIEWRWHRMTNQYFWGRVRYQYVSDFDDFCIILKRISSAFEWWHQKYLVLIRWHRHSMAFGHLDIWFTQNVLCSFFHWTYLEFTSISRVKSKYVILYEEYEWSEMMQIMPDDPKQRSAYKTHVVVMLRMEYNNIIT